MIGTDRFHPAWSRTAGARKDKLWPVTTRMTDAAAEPTGLGVDELTRLVSEAAAVIHGPMSLEQKLAWVTDVALDVSGAVYTAYGHLTDGKLSMVASAGRPPRLRLRSGLASDLVRAARAKELSIVADAGVLAVPVTGYAGV